MGQINRLQEKIEEQNKAIRWEPIASKKNNKTLGVTLGQLLT